MGKRWYRRYLIMVLLLVSILGSGFGIKEYQEEREEQEVSTGTAGNAWVIPGGMPIGIYLKTDGVLVLKTQDIEGEDGKSYEPCKHLLKAGDYIVEINGEEVTTKSELSERVEALEAEKVSLLVRRDEKEISVNLNAVKGTDGKWKLGVWVRDSVQGLGTVTFITEDNSFGALGHGIHDEDTNVLLELSEGRVYETAILSIEKGQKGSPGGMEGVIIYNRFHLLGSIEKNTDIGIFGTFKNTESLVGETEKVAVCKKSDVKTGEAVVRCSVSGEIKEYEIMIQRIHSFSLETNKGMVIQVTDEELLEITGGIIQGMSGSPILQDGKIVGAVTHVFVNDPTRGYGIFIEEMLEG